MDIEKRIEETIQAIKSTIESGKLVDRAEVEAMINENLRAFAANVEQKVRAEQEEAVAQVRAEMEANAETMLRSFALAQAVKEVDERVSTLVAEGRVAPAQSEQVRALMISLLGVEGEARAYAADDIGEAGSKSLYTLFSEFVSSLPSQLDQPQPIATRPASAEGSGADLYRAYMSGSKEAIYDLDATIQSIRKAEPSLSYYEAFRKAISSVRK